MVVASGKAKRLIAHVGAPLWVPYPDRLYPTRSARPLRGWQRSRNGRSMTSSMPHAETSMASNMLQDARHELLLSAFCVMASALPRRSQEQIALTVSARADQLTAELQEDQDAALASDLARLLGALGWLPQAVAPSAVAV